MLTFGSPWWLAGLALVPVIRWLHRGGAQHRRLPVAGLAPWKDATTPNVAGERAANPPDPAWRRRALVVACLFLALAAPRWWLDARPVTVWVDDSLSMLTREAGATRLQVGLERVGRELDAQSRTEAELRTLSRPWRSLQRGDVATRALEADAGEREPTPPPTGLVTSTREQWLLSDGTDAGLEALVAQGTFARVIRVGAPAANVGVIRIAARRDVATEDAFVVEVEVRNGGTGVQQRAVQLLDGTVAADALAQWRVRLPPDTAVVLRTEVPAREHLVALVTPADALGADDRLELDAGALSRRPATVDSSCPRSVAAAARAHPGIEVGSLAPPLLVVDCGHAAEYPGVPRLRFVRDLAPGPVNTDDWRWSTEATPVQRRRLAGLEFRKSGRLDLADSRDHALVMAGDEPLIVRRTRDAGVVTIETVLDPDGPVDAERPTAPMLLAVMVDAAFGAALLDAVAVTQREVHAVDVVPHGAVVRAPAAADPQRQPREVAVPLLVLAALLMVLEVGLMVRVWRRDRADARAVSA